jgi:protein-disulfide isomerase
MEAFNACFESNAQQAEINEDIAQARILSLPGTPSILLNGQLMSDTSFATLQQQIEAILATQ